MSLQTRIMMLGAALLVVCADASAQNPTLATAMREKLVNAQQLLDAVVTGDYADIGTGAAALGRISMTEIASWQAPRHPEYTAQATRFITAVQDLRDAARTRDLDAALTAYTDLVSSCTRCHALVRRTRLVYSGGNIR
jgi:hypothetical protein